MRVFKKKYYLVSCAQHFALLVFNWSKRIPYRHAQTIQKLSVKFCIEQFVVVIKPFVLNVKMPDIKVKLSLILTRMLKFVYYFQTLFAKMNSVENGDAAVGTAVHSTKPAAKGKQTIEKTYQKKSQLEHILLRPDTYIGSVERAQELMWIYDSDKEAMVQKQIEYVPGLYKIYDEILVNAADNKQRDPKMDCIKIEISVETNTISIWNNGKGNFFFFFL